MERLSAAQARRVALAAQGFADPRPATRVDRRHVRRVLGRIAILQIDSVNVLARSHELPLYSRLGAYPRDLLPRMAYRDRELFEYWGHMASYLPIDTHRLLRWRMARAALNPEGALARAEREHPEYLESIYDEVATRGPLAASDLEDTRTRRGKWWDWADAKTALEFLFWNGRLSAANRRRSFERVYDLTERVIPAAVLTAATPSPEAAQRELLMRSARALGVATAKDLADYYRISVLMARPRLVELVEDGSLVPVAVEGWSARAFLAPDVRVPRRVSARALLSPFDSLVWERARTERLFGVRFRIEIYTPAPKRVHGYYVLLFLLGDRIVARVDLKADRAAGALLVPASHLEPGADAAAVAHSLAAELWTLAGWLGLEQVTVADRGDLAPGLGQAVAAASASSAG